MRRLDHACPVLLALVPPLFIAANNPGEYTPRDLGQILLEYPRGVDLTALQPEPVVPAP